MNNFLGVEPITVSFAIPVAGTVIDPSTGNEYPCTDAEEVRCIITNVTGAAGRNILEELPGQDTHRIPVNVWPIDGVQWPKEIRSQTTPTGKLIWEDKEASISLKILSTERSRVAGSGLLGDLGDRAYGVVGF
ncbi:MAG: hypothetical protein AAF810_04915 [Cyanobacteria bacterium P01_D01_bin.36]